MQHSAASPQQPRVYGAVEDRFGSNLNEIEHFQAGKISPLGSLFVGRA
ncbi:MAG: hypothetical protein M3Z37_09125 [Candidatus Eremiobacteraeota bacterium]|nr:hypothetical protein [Candidatus Eremiobacteraeota bacterium]